MTGDQVGREIERSASWVSRVELGRITLRARDLRDLLDAYDIRDATVREELEELATGRRLEGWWSRYRSATPEGYATLISLEDEASVIRDYENMVFPGLLQTKEYAEAIFRENAWNWTEQDISDRITVRIKRQEILRRSTAPRLIAIVEEAVLNRVVGDRDVMTRQLKSLTTVAARPAVELLIVPVREAKPFFSATGFTVLSFSEPHPPIAYVENPTGGTIIEDDNVELYLRVFERLRDIAAGSDESIDMVNRAWERLIDASEPP
jgi:hypothetical protein